MMASGERPDRAMFFHPPVYRGGGMFLGSTGKSSSFSGLTGPPTPPVTAGRHGPAGGGGGGGAGRSGERQHRQLNQYHSLGAAGSGGMPQQAPPQAAAASSPGASFYWTARVREEKVFLLISWKSLCWNLPFDLRLALDSFFPRIFLGLL